MVLHIPKANTCYKLGMLLLIIKVFFSASRILPWPDVMDSVLSALGAFFLFVSLLNKGSKPIDYVVYVLLFLLGAYTSIRIHSISLFMSLALCCAAYSRDKEDTVRFLLAYETIFLVAQILLTFVTVLFGRNYFLEMSGEYKFTYGFNHPNTFSFILANIMLMWSWLNFDRLKIRHILMLLCIALLNNIVTGTRTTVLLMFIFLLLFCYVRVTAGSLSFAVKFAVPIIAGVQLLMQKLYLEKIAIVQIIDVLLSGRIRLGAYWLEHKGLTLFGQNLQSHVATWDETWRLSGALTMDNLYNYLMMNHGIIWFVILCLFLYRVGCEKNVRNNVFIILWVLYGIVEVQGINPIMLFPLFLITGDNSDRRMASG